MGCWDAKAKIVPPPSETDKDIILSKLRYEEKEVTIDGDTMTILVKKSETPDSVVGTAVVGLSLVR